MTIPEILKHLFAGRILTLTFGDRFDVEKFRQSLYKKKKNEDTILQDILDEKKKILRFQRMPLAENVFQYQIFLEDNPEPQFEVLFIEDASDATRTNSGPQAEDVSKGLGTASPAAEERSTG